MSLRLGVIGTGWIGATRARTARANAAVDELHLAEINPTRAQDVADDVAADSWSEDYYDLLRGDRVDAVIISTAPETTHHPITRDCLRAGKHVLLEKPIALTLAEADELIALAQSNRLYFTVGYSQRFLPKFAYVKQRFDDGSLGPPVTILISRHITRALGQKISSRGELGPAQMEATHDIDLALWWLKPARATCVYAKDGNGIMKAPYGQPDSIWIVITMSTGPVVTIGANWNLPLEAPGFSTVMAEAVWQNGAVFVDESHRDLLVTRDGDGLKRPLSTMPGERVGHVDQGPMATETNHFIASVAGHRSPLVSASEARDAMEVALAAELSAQIEAPVSLPLVESNRARRS